MIIFWHKQETRFGLFCLLFFVLGGARFLIGVPLLSGPGTMLTAVLLSSSLGFTNVLVAGLLSCLASFMVLLASSHVFKLIGKNGLEILSRVAGVLLAAFAVEYIRKGLGM